MSRRAFHSRKFLGAIAAGVLLIHSLGAKKDISPMVLALPRPLIGQEEGGQSSDLPVIPAMVKERLARLLPEPSELGASRSGEQEFFSSDLYRYIDGGADAYLDYGLVALLHQEYKASSTDITLDIYDMGAQSNAFGIYAAESSPDYHFLPIGTEGYGTSEILNFFQDQFYVKLSAFSDKEKTGPVLERFGQAVSRKIGPRGSMPEFLSLFPPQNLVNHSCKFVKKSPMGHDFLAPAIMASYRFDEEQASLVISKAPDAPGAANRVEQLRSYFARTGKVAPQSGLASGAFSGSNQFEGEALFFASGPYVIICLTPPPNSEAFLKSVRERIAERGKGVSF
jgi:hypothetical protein